MNHEEYEKMFQLEENYWWFRGRRAIVFMMFEQYANQLGRPLRILDLGCGTGKCLSDLAARGHEVVGADFSAEALSFTRRRGGAMLLRADATRLPLAEGSFDVVIALDIMEHVEKDGEMAAEMLRVLRPGGVAIVNVPAHPFLWSDHDVALHHFRRYTPSSFRAVIDRAGFDLLRFTYSIGLLFIPAVVYRMAGNVRNRIRRAEPSSHVIQTGSFLNNLFYKSICLEGRYMRRFNLPMGLSLLAVARKQ